MDHQIASIQQDLQTGMRRMTVGMLGIEHRSEVCVSILFWSVILGVQKDLFWETLNCFTLGMLWCCGNQEMLNVRMLAESVWVLRCCGTSVGKASRCLQRQSNSVRVLPLVL